MSMQSSGVGVTLGAIARKGPEIDDISWEKKHDENEKQFDDCDYF